MTLLEDSGYLARAAAAKADRPFAFRASRQVIRADALRVRLRDSGDARGKGHSDRARTVTDNMDFAADELQRASSSLCSLAGGGHAARRALAGRAGPRGDLRRQPADRLTRGRSDRPFSASGARHVDAGDGNCHSTGGHNSSRF